LDHKPTLSNIVNGEGRNYGNFWKVYELISMIVAFNSLIQWSCMHVIHQLWWLFWTYYIGISGFFPPVRHLWLIYFFLNQHIGL
jgi:hypothetical protein